MNSVSSSLSVYQGPPVTSTLGSRWNSMYIFRVGCYLCLVLGRCLASIAFSRKEEGFTHLNGTFHSLHELFLSERLQTSVNDSLVEFSFDFDVFRPYS